MPSRAATAPRAIASLLPQVDRLWLFLDRFDSVPPYAEDERIRVVRSQDVGDLRANGHLLGLTYEVEPCTFFGVGDDILYPEDYCGTLERHLDRVGRAAVGVHAGVLRSPMRSYRSDLKILHFRSAQERMQGVDVLGSGTVACRSADLALDVRNWRDVNMVDLSLARVARSQGLPLVMIPRGAGWLVALDENQADGIWTALQHGDDRQTALARDLMALPRPELPRRRIRRLRYRIV